MENISLSRKKIYDAMLRLIHLVSGLSVLMLIGTSAIAWSFQPSSLSAELWDVHISAGYIFLLALLARFLWFFLGPEAARWGGLIHWNEWRRMLVRGQRRDLTPSFGHEPKASLAYLAFYLMAVASLVTGLALAGIEHARGPFAEALFDSVWLTALFSGPHWISGSGIVAFVVAHLLGMIHHERKYGYPVLQAMFSGYQYRPRKKE